MTDYSPTTEEARAFDENLARERENAARTPPTRNVGGKEVVWAPLQTNGSQEAFMSCTYFEALYHGTRGPGKTDTLLMSYAQHVGKGFGRAWAGIILRQSYPQLADIVAKSEKRFPRIFPGARFNRSAMTWTFPGGERLLFRHMARPEDYLNYHGHEYPFIGWEELTNWPTDECFTRMMACCRCSTLGVPKMVRATTNPYGPGHNWVKQRYELAGRWWKTSIVLAPVGPDGRRQHSRAAIHGHIDENHVLLKADPLYKQTIISAASNPAMAKAWLDGDWDVVAGGLFDDVWDRRHNIVPAFQPPKSWRINRSFDWGSCAPFSVAWWAESDGSDAKINGKWRSTVKGDLFRMQEWYGWTGQPNQGKRMLAVDIARGIVERELAWNIYDVVRMGPADSAIFNFENGVSIAQDMSRPVRIGDNTYPGVQWIPADKRDGSVVGGCEMMRKMMKQAHPNPDGRPREFPGLFVTELCKDGFLRTVPTMARDDSDLDRPDKNAEDHACDDTRYRVRQVGNVAQSGTTIGMY
jgi:hypothetical protein